ncbi:MAG: hypothetical protein MMC23_007185 [Stictis urceolatum]|nr:hypothetical protein [Stictis urceolata]
MSSDDLRCPRKLRWFFVWLRSSQIILARLVILLILAGIDLSKARISKGDSLDKRQLPIKRDVLSDCYTSSNSASLNNIAPTAIGFVTFTTSSTTTITAALIQNRDLPDDVVSCVESVASQAQGAKSTAIANAEHAANSIQDKAGGASTGTATGATSSATISPELARVVRYTRIGIDGATVAASIFAFVTSTTLLVLLFWKKRWSLGREVWNGAFSEKTDW